jgi:hypothetical protein
VVYRQLVADAAAEKSERAGPLACCRRWWTASADWTCWSTGRDTHMANHDPSNGIGPDESEPPPAAVSFVTTEHFTLQGARAATIAEATGRATTFLGAVSGGLVALGLVASAGGVGAAFYAFGLVLLPTLAFVGLVTFDRVLQSGSRTSATPTGSPGSAASTSSTPPGWSTTWPACPPSSGCGSRGCRAAAAGSGS